MDRYSETHMDVVGMDRMDPHITGLMGPRLPKFGHDVHRSEPKLFPSWDEKEGARLKNVKCFFFGLTRL